jgi:hypothetical protein
VRDIGPVIGVVLYEQTTTEIRNRPARLIRCWTTLLCTPDSLTDTARVFRVLNS